MQQFRVNPGEANKLTQVLFGAVDDGWDMLVEGDVHNVSDDYDLTNNANRLSLYRKLRAMAGDDYKALHDDPSLPLDQLCITRWYPDTCGCVVTFTWDRRSPEDNRRSVPHRSEAHCKHHESHRGDHHGHAHELWAENRHKNHTINEVAAHFDVDAAEIAFKHDMVRGKRTLVLDHPKFKDRAKRVDAEIRVSSHPEASKRAVRLTRDD